MENIQNNNMETTVNPDEVFTYNAIMFADGQTWMIYSRPKAAKITILNDWKKCGGNPSVNTDYPGLQFGTVTATNRQYRDNLTSGMKNFFTAK